MAEFDEGLPFVQDNQADRDFALDEISDEEAATWEEFEDYEPQVLSKRTNPMDLEDAKIYRENMALAGDSGVVHVIVHSKEIKLSDLEARTYFKIPYDQPISETELINKTGYKVLGLRGIDTLISEDLVYKTVKGEYQRVFKDQQFSFQRWVPNPDRLKFPGSLRKQFLSEGVKGISDEDLAKIEQKVKELDEEETKKWKYKPNNK